MLKTVSTQLALASDTLPEVLAKGNTTGGTDLAVSAGDDITLADNSKVIFGAGSDFSIYSDGATGQVVGSMTVAGDQVLKKASPTLTFFDTTDAVGLNGVIGKVDFFGSDGSSGGPNNRATIEVLSENSVGNAHSIVFKTSVGNAVPTEAARFNSSKNLAFPSGNGIDFSATAGTGTSELLDDYEEGTWTPSYTASGLSVTHDNQSGSYTKIGNTVFFTLFIGTDAVSGGGGSQLNISGLPYSGSGASSSIVGLANSFNVSENDTKWAILNGSTSIALYNGASNSAGVLPSSALATFSNTNRLYVSGTYQTA